MAERETIRSGSAAWAGTVALALGAAATQGSPASALVVAGGGGVTVTPVGVDLTNYSQSSPYVVYFQGSPVFDVYYAGTGPLDGYQFYPIVGVNSGDLVNIAGAVPPFGTTIVTKLPGGVTINAATFTNAEGAGTMKNPVSFSPFFVPLEVTTDGGTDWYYGWAEFSDGNLIFDQYAFSNSENTGLETPVPEPGTWALLALGAAGILAIRRRGRSLAQARAH
jgi:hypothetical protein